MKIYSIYSNTKIFIFNPSKFSEKYPVASIIASIALKILGASSSITCALLYVSLKETLVVNLTLSILGILSLISFIYSLTLDYRLINKAKKDIQNKITITKIEINNISKKIDEVSNKSAIGVLNNMVNENPSQNGYEMGNFIGRYIKTSLSRSKGFFYGLYQGIFN